MELDIEFKGIDELQAKLQRIYKEYPDAVEDKLQKIGRQFKKEVIAKTPASKIEHPRKLKKSYKLSKVQKDMNGFYITFGSTAPHFHLIERGHRIVNRRGEVLGFQPGVHMVEKTVKEFEMNIKDDLEEWADGILKELDKT